MIDVYALRGAGEGILEYIFGEVYRLPECERTISYGRHGKPFLPSGAGLFFSLAHAGGWTFCAVADAELGLDAEAVTRCDDGICDLYFTKKERGYLRAAAPECRDRLFIKIWTLKESRLKYWGTGFFKPPQSFGVPRGALKGACFYDKENDCSFAGLTFPPDILLSLCTKKPCVVSAITVIGQNHNGIGATSMNHDFYPLTEAQYNIWLSEQYFKGSAVNVLHAALWLSKPVDAGLLQSAVNSVVPACNIFGLRFTYADEKPAQFFAPPERIYCALDEKIYPLAAVRAELAERCARAFAFEGEPLFDFHIYPLWGGGCVLSIRIHHILIDGFGMGLLCDKILRTYHDMAQGLTPSLGESLFSPAAEVDLPSGESKAFWGDYLRGLPPKPVLFPQTARGLAKLCLCKRLSRGLTARIAGFCAAEGVRPYTVFAAALALYLMGAAGAGEAVLVLPRLNRATEEERGCVGAFTLAVPVRVRAEENDSFAALCRRIQAEGRTVTQHKGYGYSRILSDHKSAGAEGDGLTEYTLNFQKGRLKAPVPARLEFSSCGEMSNHITLNVSDWSESGRYELTYDCRAELCDERRAGFLHASLLRLIEQGLKSKKPALGFKLLAAEEEKLLRRGLRGEALPYSPDCTIPSLFARAARENGEKLAIAAFDGSLTYNMLDELSNRAANALLERGVKPGDILAFLLPRDSRLLPCILGILKAGAVFLPLDPQYPQGRVDYILEDSGAAGLVSCKALAGERGFWRIDELLAHKNPKAPTVKIAQEQPAYCIYTSGTTGSPKGVLLSHRGLVNITRPGGNPFNKALCASGRGLVAIGSISFDISLFELFVPLLNGRFVVLAREDELADPVAIAALLQKYGANILHCTPSRLAAYLREPAFCKALEGVDMILSAGEVLPAALTEDLKRRYGISIYNGYGPTEATIGATITEAGDSLTIGKPIANAAVLLLDAQKKPVPFGAQGEIAIGGDGVGIGYLNNKGLTAEKFVTLFGGRFYLTGDIGCWTRDGRLMFLGRKDQQVKLRGLRIELPEIENRLLACKGVALCAVLVREVAGQQHLAAFYTAKGDVKPEDLKRGLGRFLAAYMIPDIFVRLEQMSLTVNGKIDLKALKDYPLRQERRHVKPATMDEKILCGVFKAVLKAQSVGAEDNFFELGGTSLLAASVMLSAKKEGLAPSYSDIFEYPTPRLLAGKLRSTDGTAEGVGLAGPDYSKIAHVLAQNRRFRGGGRKPLGNVLLTGATGYLGIHILKELLEQKADGKIVCLVRPKGGLSAEKRLKGALYYYFETMFPVEFEARVIVAEGDITSHEIFSTPPQVRIDTIINSAANVAHFAYGDTLSRVNTGGVKNLIAFAKKQSAAIVHISTISVGGCCTEDELKSGALLTEASLFIGQRISNAYLLSKYKAEYLLLAAAAEGLPVKLMRVGNLQGRLSDGEFQMNLNANAFTRRLRAYIMLKKAPKYLLNTRVNLSPVDDTARAVVLLAQTELPSAVFHALHPDDVPFSMLARAAGELGHTIEFIGGGEFEGLVEALSKDGSPVVQDLLLERPDIRLREVPVSCAFTAEALGRQGFAWGKITREYLRSYFNALEGMGFFS